MSRLTSLFSYISVKTLYFNFKYLPFQDAFYLPIRISPNVKLLKTGGQITIAGPLRRGMIKIGYGDIGIFDKKASKTIIEIAGKITFLGTADIGHGSKICVMDEGEIVFGNNFVISAESTIVSAKKIVFGNDCLLSWDILIMDTDWHKIYDQEQKHINPDREIIIGNHVWIGCRSTVLKGAQIPQGSVIAANSLVTKNLTGVNNIFGGNPLRVIKDKIAWLA